uniref:Uncharacterized protein n=1 Tax=Plectus sambesii TaxID=2011161 RepID=A0A914V027_9BILA
MRSHWGACTQCSHSSSHSTHANKRSLTLPKWLQRLTALVIVYVLVHLCLLLAVLTPVLRRCIPAAAVWRLLSVPFSFFRSSSDERPISTEPSLPPGAVVPDIVPVPPPTIERPRMNEEDIMTELRDLLDGWSPPEGSSSNGDQPTDERQPDSNGSDDDSSMSVGDSSSNVRPSQLQLNTNVDDKDHRGWTGRSDPTSNGGHIPSVIEPAATAESGDSSAPSASTEDVTYSSFNYWQPTYDPTVVDEDASTSGTRSSTADGSEDIIRNFMERRC